MSTRNVSILKCMWCKTTVQTDSQISALLCGRCTARLSDAPAPVKSAPPPLAEGEEPRKRGRPRKNPITEKIAAGRGRGWHLKKIVKYDDVYFSYGKPVTEDEAAALGYTVNELIEV